MRAGDAPQTWPWERMAALERSLPRSPGRARARTRDRGGRGHPRAVRGGRRRGAPFADGEFDVVSAFGVMFGPHGAIAAEIARVCEAETLRESFRPLRRLLERPDEPNADALRREFVAAGHRFAGRTRFYVLVLGRKR